MLSVLLCSFAISAPNSSPPPVLLFAYDSLVRKGGLLDEASAQAPGHWKLVSYGSSAEAPRVVTRELSGKKSGVIVAGLTDDLIAGLPVGWKIAEQWALDESPMTLVVNRNLIEQPEPTSLQEYLNDPKYDRTLLWQDPRTSALGTHLLYAVHQLNPSEWKANVKLLAKKTFRILPSWTDAYALFGKDAAPFVWTFATSEAYHRIDESKGKKTLIPRSELKNYSCSFREGHVMYHESIVGLLPENASTSTRDELLQSLHLLKTKLHSDWGREQIYERQFMLLPNDKSVPVAFEFARALKSWKIPKTPTPDQLIKDYKEVRL